MKLEEFNKQSLEKARADLFMCCGSQTWVDMLMKYFPFKSIDDVKNKSDEIWKNCKEKDLMEAFSHHPKIGENAEVKNTPSKGWAKQEQSGIKNADESILSELAEANRKYEENFGYIFIVCATGKSAVEMLNLLKVRLNNDAEKELKIAAREQNKITHLRIDKLLS